MQQAVCCDVVDKGVMDTGFGPKHKIDVRWQAEEKMPSGKPYLIVKRYTLSLNEKATLRKDLESWRGKAFTQDELEGFDVEKLIGANALLNIVHNVGKKGGTFANVAAVAPLVKGMAKIAVSADYVRVKDQTTEPEPSQTENTDDDRDYDAVPF
jgi:hypothetical protein